jgi:hypothetical protein
VKARELRLVLLAAVAAHGWACGPSADASDRVFTPAHRTTADAIKGFFGARPHPVQPIPFPHSVHIAKGLTCTDYCHESVTKGPIAGLPSVATCMICHDSIAKNRPIIQRIAGYQEQGLDISWQRVYGYTAEAHVRFNHAPHVRAGVSCNTCHGDVARQTVAERALDLNMGFCVNCHRSKRASNDCLTCHY